MMSTLMIVLLLFLILILLACVISELLKIRKTLQSIERSTQGSLGPAGKSRQPTAESHGS